MKSFFSVFLLFICLLSSGQTLRYDAILRGHSVGELKVVKEVSDNKTTIETSTHIVAHMLFKITVDVTTKSTYMDGVLIESEAVSKQNGHIHESVYIHKTDNGYSIDVDGEKEQLNVETLIGADTLYFEEPKSISHTMALASAQYLDIEKGKGGAYFFVHDGKKESHQYKAGVLEEVVIEHKLYTVTMKRKQ